MAFKLNDKMLTSCHEIVALTLVYMLFPHQEYLTYRVLFYRFTYSQKWGNPKKTILQNYLLL